MLRQSEANVCHVRHRWLYRCHKQCQRLLHPQSFQFRFTLAFLEQQIWRNRSDSHWAMRDEAEHCMSVVVNKFTEFRLRTWRRNRKRITSITISKLWLGEIILSRRHSAMTPYEIITERDIHKLYIIWLIHKRLKCDVIFFIRINKYGLRNIHKSVAWQWNKKGVVSPKSHLTLSVILSRNHCSGFSPLVLAIKFINRKAPTDYWYSYDQKAPTLCAALLNLPLAWTVVNLFKNKKRSTSNCQCSTQHKFKIT